MERVRKLALVCGCCMVLAASMPQALAMWAQRPPIVWLKSTDGKFEAKWITKTGEITVYEKGKRDKPLWKATLSEFNQTFSFVRLAGAGKYIVHVRGNMMATKLDATAVEIISRGDQINKINKSKQPTLIIRRKLKVKDFTDEIKGLKRGMGGGMIMVSDGPQARWLNPGAAGVVTDTTVVVTTIKGEQKTVDLATGKIIGMKTASQMSARVIAIPKREHGYNNFKTQVIRSAAELKKFQAQIAEQQGWNSLAAFTKAINAAKIDFRREALVLIRHTEGSGSIPVSLAAPKLENGRVLVCNVKRTPLKPGMVGTADMAYYGFAVVISRRTVGQIAIQVNGKEKQRLPVAVRRKRPIEKGGVQIRPLPAKAPPVPALY